MNLPAYLARIAHTSPTTPTPETLRALHRAHMFAVPFENLDIHLGRKILCDESRILHKLINEHRGGFCYELNGAFAVLLRTLGFEVTLLSARVSRVDGTVSPEFDHLALRVDIPGSDAPWLADVGFGDCFLEPLRLQLNIEQPQIGRVYRITESRGTHQVEALPNQTKSDATWKPQYTFTLLPRQFSDFAAMCHYHQTSPNSHFTRQRICSRATPHGRITLSDFKLIETHDGKREEHTLLEEQQWRAALKESFQIELPTETTHER